MKSVNRQKEFSETSIGFLRYIDQYRTHPKSFSFFQTMLSSGKRQKVQFKVWVPSQIQDTTRLPSFGISFVATFSQDNKETPTPQTIETVKNMCVFVQRLLLQGILLLNIKADKADKTDTKDTEDSDKDSAKILLKFEGNGEGFMDFFYIKEIHGVKDLCGVCNTGTELVMWIRNGLQMMLDNEFSSSGIKFNLISSLVKLPLNNGNIKGIWSDDVSAAGVDKTDKTTSQSHRKRKAFHRALHLQMAQPASGIHSVVLRPDVHPPTDDAFSC